MDWLVSSDELNWSLIISTLRLLNELIKWFRCIGIKRNISKQNSLIEKIYTEQQEQETPFVTSFIETTTSTGKTAALSVKSKPPGRSTTTGCALVMTKTSPLVMADLNCDEDDEVLGHVVKRPQQQQQPVAQPVRYPQPSLIDTGKHEIIKQVSDSMDHLRNELLQKGEVITNKRSYYF